MALNSCLGINPKAKSNATNSTSMNKQETMKKYTDEDVMVSISVTKHNIANPQYNYVVTVFGNGNIVRKGGVYEKDHPTTITKEVLDTIVSKALQIDDFSTMPPRQAYHDAPTCNLSVFGYPIPLDFCSMNNEGVQQLVEYINEQIVLPTH
ncbi:MAG: hypothetical protein AB8E82_01165, partial [Aureispira sp.]